MTFDVDRFQDALETRWVGRRLRHFASLDSTNAYLKREARAEGLEAGSVAVADAQTAGYGQRGRVWVSAPHDGLYFSVWLPLSLTQRPLTLLAGVAAVTALRALMQTDEIALKWVNDLVCRGRKLGGILAEALAGHAAGGVALGIGINLATPEALEGIGLGALGEAPRRDAMLAGILNHLEAGLDRLDLEGDRPLCDRWKAMAVTLGTDVRVEAANGSFEGRAEDITDSGALVIRAADGSRRTVASGTVRRSDGRYC